MTAAVIALSVALAAAIAAIGYLAVRLVRVTPDLVQAGKNVVAEAERAQAYREERDEALVRLKEAGEREAAAIVRLKLAERQRNQAQEEATRRVVETIRSRPVADAARIVDELLAAPLPGVPQADPATAAGDRPAEDALRASSPAGAHRAGADRGPGGT